MLFRDPVSQAVDKYSQAATLSRALPHALPSARTKISARTSLPSRGHVEMSGEGFSVPVPGRVLYCAASDVHERGPQCCLATAINRIERAPFKIAKKSVCRGEEILRQKRKAFVTEAWCLKTH